MIPGTPPNVPIVQRPRTWPFQGQDTGSNPVGDASLRSPESGASFGWASQQPPSERLGDTRRLSRRSAERVGGLQLISQRPRSLGSGRSQVIPNGGWASHPAVQELPDSSPARRRRNSNSDCRLSDSPAELTGFAPASRLQALIGRAVQPLRLHSPKSGGPHTLLRRPHIRCGPTP
jgi:hypothetical protein